MQLLLYQGIWLRINCAFCFFVYRNCIRIIQLKKYYFIFYVCLRVRCVRSLTYGREGRWTTSASGCSSSFRLFEAESLLLPVMPRVLQASWSGIFSCLCLLSRTGLLGLWTSIPVRKTLKTRAQNESLLLLLFWF